MQLGAPPNYQKTKEGCLKSKKVVLGKESALGAIGGGESLALIKSLI